MPTTITQGRQQIEKQYQDITPEQAIGKLTAMPAQMVHEARYALQQLRDTFGQQQTGGSDVQQVFDVVEPLVRAVGWAEALAFAQITQQDVAFQALRLGNGSSN